MTVAVLDEQELDVPLEDLHRLAVFVLADRDVPPTMEVTVSCVDVAAMTALHETHLGEPGPTDVLAFPLDAPDEVTDGVPALLGDVVVCPEVARVQAHERGAGLHGELQLLVVHGLLHLLGHDHHEAQERAEMFALTDRLLRDHRGRAASCSTVS